MSGLQACGLSVEGRLHDVSLTVQRGELVGIIGPNGAGKSTLLAGLAGVQAHTGVVMVESSVLLDQSPRQRARLVGYLPQAGQSAWALTVADVVAMGRLPWGDQDAAAIAEAMAAVGVAPLSARAIDMLSGGEQARVWLARVLAGKPHVLLADEPVASLDLYYQRSVMQALRGFADAGGAALVALHDLGLSARYCDRLLLLANGRIVAEGTPAQVLEPSLLETVYGLPVTVDLQRSPPHVGYR